MKIEFSQGIKNKVRRIYKRLGIPCFKINSPDGKEYIQVLGVAGNDGFNSGITYHDSDGTLIGYNDSEPIHKQAVVLLHELGHALLNTWDKQDETPICKMEKGEFFADMFACIMTALELVQYDASDNSRGGTAENNIKAR